jgi:hypothetical protein
MLNAKICEICTCSQELIGCGEVRVTLIKLGPLRCLMPTGMEHVGECKNEGLSEVFIDMICAPYLILDVEMKFL